MFTQLKGVALANAVILWLCSLCSITYVTLEIWLIIICDDDDDDDGGGGGGGGGGDCGGGGGDAGVDAGVVWWLLAPASTKQLQLVPGYTVSSWLGASQAARVAQA